MIRNLIAIILLLALAAGGLWVWQTRIQGGGAAGPPDGGPPPAIIASAKVEPQSWLPRLKAVGSLVAVERVQISSQVPGQVETITFESGQAVAQGDVLLRLDADVDRADLAALEAERDAADADFRRAAELLERGHRSRAAYDRAEAELGRLEAEIDAQRERIDRKTVRAPFSGRLGIRDIDVGAYIEAGQPIIRLQRLDPIHADFSLPERHLPELAPGQTVELRLTAYPERVFEGRITAIDPGIAEETRSVRLRATLDNPADATSRRLLRPGMFADLSVIAGAAREMLTIPRTAVAYAPYGDSVFVIAENEQGQQIAQRRRVRTGQTRAGRVAVTEGLEAGETVVAAGHVKLRDGQPVEVDNSIALDPDSVTGP